jgi:hypothetical protein
MKQSHIVQTLLVWFLVKKINNHEVKIWYILYNIFLKKYLDCDILDKYFFLKKVLKQWPIR